MTWVGSAGAGSAAGGSGADDSGAGSRGGTSRRATTLASIVLAGAGLLACGDAQEPLPVPIDVAVAVPFAGTGVMADARQGWQLVLDSINEAGGVGGRPLRVIERDTPLTAADDLSPIADGFAELANEGHRYIISLVSGDALQPVLETASTNGVLAMSITSEEPAAAGLLARRGRPLPLQAGARSRRCTWRWPRSRSLCAVVSQPTR